MNSNAEINIDGSPSLPTLFVVTQNGVAKKYNWDDLKRYINESTGFNSAIKNNSEFTGVQDNTNTVFTLPDEFITNSTRVYVNGIRQKIGIGNDYIENNNTIVFAFPPDSTDNLIIDYIKE
jgi:hypothetical protein